jgi:hypothetical protein
VLSGVFEIQPQHFHVKLSDAVMRNRANSRPKGWCIPRYPTPSRTNRAEDERRNLAERIVACLYEDRRQKFIRHTSVGGLQVIQLMEKRESIGQYLLNLLVELRKLVTDPLSVCCGLERHVSDCREERYSGDGADSGVKEIPRNKYP